MDILNNVVAFAKEQYNTNSWRVIAIGLMVAIGAGLILL